MSRFLLKTLATMIIAFALLVWVVSDTNSSEAEQAVKEKILEAADETGSTVEMIIDKVREELEKSKEENEERLSVSFRFDLN